MHQELRSKEDASVNIVEENLQGFIESRYVRRSNDYFNCYLSSQTGCNKGCRFCHLTATKQTQFVNVTTRQFLDQAQSVFDQYYKSGKSAKRVHYSFMARGEPLSNLWILRNGEDLLRKLGEFALGHQLQPKFNISTIMPKSLDYSLVEIFPLITPTIYYSLYSPDERFREKWMPQAMPVPKALDMLKDYQESSKKLIKIHYAFIKGENDSREQLERMCDMIEFRGLRCEFNLVRYNPFSAEQGVESDEQTLHWNLEYLQQRLGAAKMIQRVGFDVKASCGMFVQ